MNVFFSLASSKDIEKNQRNDSEDVKYLAFVTNGDLYSCPCVIISERHLLASGSCIRRHERGLEIIAGVVPHTYDANDIDNDDERAVRKISKIKYHDQYVNQVRSMRIHNSFVVLTVSIKSFSFILMFLLTLVFLLQSLIYKFDF